MNIDLISAHFIAQPSNCSQAFAWPLHPFIEISHEQIHFVLVPPLDEPLHFCFARDETNRFTIFFVGDSKHSVQYAGCIRVNVIAASERAMCCFWCRRNIRYTPFKINFPTVNGLFAFPSISGSFLKCYFVLCASAPRLVAFFHSLS